MSQPNFPKASECVNLNDEDFEKAYTAIYGQQLTRRAWAAPKGGPVVAGVLATVPSMIPAAIAMVGYSVATGLQGSMFESPTAVVIGAVTLGLCAVGLTRALLQEQETSVYYDAHFTNELAQMDEQLKSRPQLGERLMARRHEKNIEHKADVNSGGGLVGPALVGAWIGSSGP